MSAASPKVSDKAQEPSMEEILASIRRIIADDQNAKTEAEAPARPAPPPETDDVLDLAEIAQPIRKAAPLEDPVIAFKAPVEKAPIEDGQIDFDAISFDDDEPEPEPLPPPPPPPKAAPVEPPRRAPEPDPWALDLEPEPSTATERLTSAVTDASVAQAFHLLSTTVMSSQARTLEELVQDMLRPLLKSWLDENLPSMVERLVRAEIERVARGR